jgi:peptidoglycan/LPS O-acetylase OafA/YrhL
MLVILQHVAWQPGAQWLLPIVERTNIGHQGVRVFFVISGLLITTLLLDEQRRTGTIKLREFYWRRTLRIMPPYYVFLGISALIALVGIADIALQSVVWPAVYLADYHPMPAWLAHTWSLSVEEQFYLLWPGLLLLAGPRRAIRIAGVLAILAALIRPYLYTIPGWPTPRYTFEGSCDALFVGCILAYVRDELWSRTGWRSFLASPLCLVVVLALALQYALPLGDWYRRGISPLMINIGIALGVEWCLRHPTSGVGRLLNWGPIAYIGTLSYSIYLWQEPFAVSRFPRLGPLGTFPGLLVLIAGSALASYYLVERPVLRWRDRRRQ